MSEITPGVEKLMSISADEFARSMGDLLSFLRLSKSTSYDQIPVGAGTACVTSEIVDPVRLGGLLVLQRMRVKITFNSVEDHYRNAFLQAYESAFQRGGG
jgi:hypothetical protein